MIFAGFQPNAFKLQTELTNCTPLSNMMIKVTPFSICTYIFHCPINTVRIQIQWIGDIYPDISCDQCDLIAVGSLGQ